ncbi:MAG TPA: SpoVR family protein [Chloroflexi bacterium]|nr:SpoVR family protein [Chloroflexota bacterium]
MYELRTGLSPELERERETIRHHALDYGLDFFEVIFEVVDFQQMNEVAAYMGFPTRYPHWRWGMEYERLKKSYSYGLHRIYEMVINNDPSYAYLLDSNELIDQKIVMAHVYGHSDFFKTNLWFAHTNRKMMDEMANHATRVQRHVERIGLEEVEDFVDVCLSLDNLIDRHAPYIRRRSPVEDQSGIDPEIERRRPEVPRLPITREYMDRFINPPDYLKSEAARRREAAESQKHRFPAEAERDVLLFLLEHAPLDTWQQDLLSIIREEAYYFVPQGMTKVMNEGWACLAAGSLIFTAQGVLRLEDLVRQKFAGRVSDGQTFRYVYDWATFDDRETVWIRTQRGLEVEGSLTHRVMMADGSWRRLDEVQIGDQLLLTAGANQWAQECVPVDWQPQRRITLSDVATEVGVDIETVIRSPRGVHGRNSEQLAPSVAEYDAELAVKTPTQNKRRAIRVPTAIDEKVGAFLGYLVGDGHINEVKRAIGLTTGNEGQADRFAGLVEELFGITPHKKWDQGCYEVLFQSNDVEDFLKYLGLETERAGWVKEVPEVILRSPKEVVAAFLRAYFDCNGYAGRQGVLLSNSSDSLGQVVQLLLLNFGILSRRLLKDGSWHLHVTGTSAATFLAAVGFGLDHKQRALRSYVENHHCFKSEEWHDTIVAIEHRRADVYDISVEDTHRYAAQGFINHNSFWHSTIMTQSGVMTDAEVVDYADHHSGTVAMSPHRINPYKIGLELFRDIEERWNKGQFGKAWEECDDLRARREWDLQLDLGRQKIFEVRSVYNDIGFIDTFFTEDFCNRHQLFTYKYNERTGYYEIDSRDFQMIKQKLLFSLTNFGQPVIVVQDANYSNRGELYLKHQHEGVDLKLDEARDTLTNLHRIWRRPVHVETVVEGTPRLLSFDGQEHSFRKLR